MDAGLLIGRILLVAIFIFSGTVKFVDLSGTAGHIAEQGLPTPTALAFLAGMVEVVGGLMVAIGWHTKPAALMLAAFSTVAAFFFHDFWNVPPGEQQIDQMLHAFKNVTIVGGLIVLACVGPGSFAVDVRRSSV